MQYLNFYLFELVFELDWLPDQMYFSQNCEDKVKITNVSKQNFL